MSRTICIIQARMGSTRLPGKVAKDLAGKPMLLRVIERARQIEKVDEVIVATSTLPGDDHIIELTKDADAPTFRGSENDVLSRYFEAAEQYKAENIIRITADCPLLDPEVSTIVVKDFMDKKPDYASNTLERTFPRGLDTEVLAFHTLKVAHLEATENADREHVTRFVWRHPARFALLSIRGQHDLSGHRWTVDTTADLELVRKIYREYGDQPFGMNDVLSLLDEHPEWRKINSHVEQKKT